MKGLRERKRNRGRGTVTAAIDYGLDIFSKFSSTITKTSMAVVSHYYHGNEH